MLLYRKIDHPEDYVALQMDINSVNNWIKGNYLRPFNASKCKYMLISYRRQHRCDPLELLLDNFSLVRFESIKYLWGFFSIQTCHGQITLHLFVPKLA